MTEERELDRISELFRRESEALRRRTLVLSAIPVVVGAIVVVTAYLGVADARARLAETQKLRDSLAAEIEQLEARRVELEEEVKQQKAVATHLKEKLPQEEKQTADLVQSGLEAYNQGDWEAAVETLESAVERDAGLAETQFGLGVSLWRTGRTDEALERIRTALELNPSYEERARNDPRLKQLWDYLQLAGGRAKGASAPPDEHLEKALRSADGGSYEQAVDEFGKALEADPDNATVHGLKGYALYKQGRLDEAIASLQRCLDLDPTTAECHFNLGLARWQEEDRPSALASFRKAFELDPKLEERARQNPVYRVIEKTIESGSTIKRRRPDG